MQTEEEKKHKVVVESSLRELARQLKIMNRLEEFRFRKVLTAENEPIITEIMEDEE